EYPSTFIRSSHWLALLFHLVPLPFQLLTTLFVSAQVSLPYSMAGSTVELKIFVRAVLSIFLLRTSLMELNAHCPARILLESYPFMSWRILTSWPKYTYCSISSPVTVIQAFLKTSDCMYFVLQRFIFRPT
uniref:Uncharacterized protein n=1 Tax=Chrysemys picta bellii TaxID=8478 RepID=A0A8C3IIA6_CHRPI